MKTNEKKNIIFFPGPGKGIWGFIMMKLERDFKNKTIGRWQYPTQGRPSEESERIWLTRCNFVLRVTAVLQSSQSSGWCIRVDRPDSSRTLFLSCEHASNTAALKRKIMKSQPGLIARLTSEDFLEFVEEDTKSGNLRTIQLVDEAGKHVIEGKTYWVFSNVVLDATGEIVEDPCVRVNPDLEKNTFYFSTMSKMSSFKTDRFLANVGAQIREYFGPRQIHALHVLSSALKACLRDEILERESILPISNISGPPNIGKTLASCMALKMLNSDQTILSHATPSALLDMCHNHRSMLMVWDDPRDTNIRSLSTIVHEAFHGHPNSTMSRGVRMYNSTIMIGTQQRFAGLPVHTDNVPTISRLVHIDMGFMSTSHLNRPLQHLKKCFDDLPCVFFLLVQQRYDWKETERLYKRLQSLSSADVLERALRIAAIEWCLCKQMNALGFRFAEEDIDYYFVHIYLPIIQQHCCRIPYAERFFKDMKSFRDNLGELTMKDRVVVELSTGLTSCVAICMKHAFKDLQKLTTLTYSMENVQGDVKHSSQYGVLNHNVCFKVGDRKVVQRCLVVPKDVWDSL